MQIFIGDDGSDPNRQKEQRIELQMDSDDPDKKIQFEMGHGLGDSEMQQIIADNPDLSDSELEQLLEQKFAEIPNSLLNSIESVKRA